MKPNKKFPRLARNFDLIADEVRHERARQDMLWGAQTHEPYKWLAILTEEVGEAAKAAYEAESQGKSLTDYREELIQVAAVAFAMVECLDKQKGK